MVKIGFICEGKTETLFLSSDNFNEYLISLGLEKVNVINAETQGNLLPHNISFYITQLTNEGASVIFILTDLDKDACITFTKQRIQPRDEDVFIVAVKEVEAWFLANTPAMRLLLNDTEFVFEFPENEDEPFDVINTLFQKNKGRGIGRRSGKIKLIKKLLDLNLKIEDSALHDNCPSAKYFIQKLLQTGSQK